MNVYFPRNIRIKIKQIQHRQLLKCFVVVGIPIPNTVFSSSLHFLGPLRILNKSLFFVYFFMLTDAFVFYNHNRVSHRARCGKISKYLTTHYASETVVV